MQRKRQVRGAIPECSTGRSTVLMAHEEVPRFNGPWTEDVSSGQAELADMLMRDPDLSLVDAADAMETTIQGLSRVANSLRCKGIIVPRRKQR